MAFVILDQCPHGCMGADLGNGEVSGCTCNNGMLADGRPKPPNFQCDCPNHVVKTVEKLGCDVIYQGTTYPHLHGTKCAAEYHEHDMERHYSGEVVIGGKPDVIYWYTPAQKAKIHDRG